MIGLKSIARTALVLSASGAVFSGCGGSDQAEGALPRQETLYLSGQQWGAPATFNPLAESWMAAWPVGGRFNLVYEPLVTYNTLNGQIEDLLGHLVEELSNNDSIVVDLNPAATWSDGKQVNSNDVKFMFTKGSINTAEQISAIHVDTIYAEPAAEDTAGERKMVGERLAFIVNKAQRNNPLSVRDLLQAIRIAPAHVFEPLIAEKGLDEVKKLMIDKNPVVSGPYTIKDYSANKIILERRIENRLLFEHGITLFVKLLALDHDRIAFGIDVFNNPEHGPAKRIALGDLHGLHLSVLVEFRLVDNVALIIQFGHTESLEQGFLLELGLIRSKALSSLTHDDVDRVVFAHARQGEVDCNSYDKRQKIPESLLQDIA